MQSSRLVRAVFALIVLATVGAFAVTQVLKTELPVVLRFAVKPIYFSPNGDGARDSTEIGFDLTEPAEVSFSIVDEDGNVVRQLFSDRQLAGDAKHRFRWAGRDDDGNIVPDGTYRMVVDRRKEGRRAQSYKEIHVETEPPKVALRATTPGVVDPSSGEPVAVTVRYRGPKTRGPEFRVWRTDDGDPYVVRRFRGDNRRRGVWNGTVGDGSYAPDGDYALQVRVRDRAGNVGLSPAEVTPRRARPGTGVAVRRLTLEGPGGVVTAGSVAKLDIGPAARRHRWRLTRLGSGAAIKQGSGNGDRLRIRMPDDARTGVYVVSVTVSTAVPGAADGKARRAGRRGRKRSDRPAPRTRPVTTGSALAPGGERDPATIPQPPGQPAELTARWPLVVAGLPPRGVPADRPRPLLVLPAITWQGLNRFDSDLDGFADTLAAGDAIPADRPYAGGRLPARLTRESAPLLDFLDRARQAYDLTTDLALARGEGPALGNAPGVAIGGSAIWLTRGLRDRLLAEVAEQGKPVAVFGGESLRRSVALDGDRLRDPSPPRPDDLFGERTRPERVDPPAPLAVERDELDLFTAVDALFGSFSRIERSVALPDGAELLSAAGREAGEPAFVGYALGDGTVIRVGSPQWTDLLAESALDVEVPRVTRRIWQLLGGR
ncbi:MAG: hypothetical protein GXY03_15595 [Solirubrobacterales bacterium]|nr:hypothetical protein [Solirubrobacterales bacterium]